MMRLTYTFVFLLIISTQGNSQDYIPFDLTNAKWVMSYLVPWGGFNAKTSFGEVYTKGDTLIDGKQYTKIAMRNLCRLYNSADGVTLEEDMVTEEYELGALREEDKRVYFYRFDEETPNGYYVLGRNQEAKIDHLLYDFNAVVGDTIHYSSGRFSIVTEIGYNNGVKTFEIINNGDESFPNVSDGLIREGRGSDDGLFAAYFSDFSWLECYGSSQAVDGIACTVCKNYVTTSSGDIFITNADVLYPNPAYDRLSLREEYADQLGKITVYNIHGQRLRELKFTKGDYNIDLLDFSSGMLLFELEFKNGQRKIEKVVKRH